MLRERARNLASMADATTIAELVGRLEAYLGQVTGGTGGSANVTGSRAGPAATRGRRCQHCRRAGGRHPSIDLASRYGRTDPANALSRGQEFKILQVMWEAGVAWRDRAGFAKIQDLGVSFSLWIAWKANQSAAHRS